LSFDYEARKIKALEKIASELEKLNERLNKKSEKKSFWSFLGSGEGTFN